MNSKKLRAHFLILLLMAAFALSASPALAESPPRTPSSVSVSRSDGSLTASWPAVKNATSYHVTYSDDGGASWSLAALNHGGTSITVSVNNSKSYIVGVRARNSSGDSGWRNSYAIGPYNPPKPPPPPKPPATPGVISVSRSDGALHAFWNSVGGATSYHVTYTGDNGASWSLAALNHPAGNGTTSITITGVDNDKPYIVGVRSRNSAGDSVWRNSSSTGRYEPPPAPPKPPAAPTALSATGSDKSVTLSWTKPSGDVTGYQFQFRAAPPAPGWGGWYTVPDGDGNTTRYTIKGLENGTEYRFKLRAVNSGAVSAPAPTSAPWFVSATPDPNVQPPPPPKPPSAPPAPSSVTATRGDGTIVASWHHSEGATGYDVRYSTDKGGSWKLAALHWNTSVITIKGASRDKSYIVGVRAVNLVGASDWTNSNTVEALTLTASNVTATGATLSIGGHSGAWWYKSATTGKTACTSAGSNASVSVTGLTAGTSYVFSAYSDSTCTSGNLLATASSFTTPVTVSTLDGAWSQRISVGNHNSGQQQGAQAFTTGSHTGGYTLSGIDIRFANKVGSPSNLVVTLHGASGSNPDTTETLATLSGNSSPSAGVYTYTCSGSGCDLSASTTYFVLLKAPSSPGTSYYQVDLTTAAETKQPSDNGWSIANNARKRLYGTWYSVSLGAYQIKVSAVPK